MALNNEPVGERVFGNVDEALAERIISRARRNSGEPEPAAEAPVGCVDKPCSRRKASSILKIAFPVVLILIALWVLVKRLKDV